ncbi:MAG: type I DNA topoisomerase [Rickettsiales bacterium]|nr:type I DNA topoisomerase [Rickettsiales bacterium]
MKLVIVESPAKAKTIGKYLGPGYKVLASYGHVRDLPSKNGSVLPDQNFKMTYQISPKSKKIMGEIAKTVKNCDELILATDPDREGESISWHILESLKETKKLPKEIKISRVAFNEITKSSIKNAISAPRQIDDALVSAQQARRALDYLVGFSISPILWRKLPGSMSAGRVQSVALRILCEREKEIEVFQKKEYWSILFNFSGSIKEAFEARLIEFNGDKLEKFSLVNQKQTDDILSVLKSKDYILSDVELSDRLRKPFAPFTTSTLQQEASRKLGMSTKVTMMVAQKLYEGIEINGDPVGLITYMRTDGIYMAKEAVDAVRNYVKENYSEKYLPKSPRLYKSKVKNAQEAHEAIRPTVFKYPPEKIRQYLDDQQFKLYKLIWDRAVASQMADAIMANVRFTINSNDKIATARATGSTVKFDGFLKLYPVKVDEAGNLLPNLHKGENLNLIDVNGNQHFTEPPPRYSEASLVKKLEELGIGRPSTYSSIISILVDRGYAKFDSKKFVPEIKGRVTTAFLVSFFEQYFEYDFTAKLEEDLDIISNGELSWQDFLNKFWSGFENIIAKIQEKAPPEIADKLTNELNVLLFGLDGKPDCPECKEGKLVLKTGKFGAYLSCNTYPDCKHTRPLNSNASVNDSAVNQQIEQSELGVDENGNPIELKQGPYGPYIAVLNNKTNKPKNYPIPKNVDKDNIDRELALKIISLPRIVGIHPSTNSEIKASYGKFGPYLLYEKKFYSLKEDDVFEVSLEKAVTLIENYGSKTTKSSGTLIGKHPDTNDDITLHSGKYGSYLKYAKKNYSIGKDLDSDKIELDQAIDIIKNSKK